MTGIIQHSMRIVLTVLLFQFICPAFLSIVTEESTTREEHGIIHARHTSILIPLLLKEKEEDESETMVVSRMCLVPLIDFKDHSTALIGLHSTRIRPFAFQNRIDHQPPLFTLHSVLLV